MSSDPNWPMAHGFKQVLLELAEQFIDSDELNDEILDAVQDVDGPGSSINADLLDGHQLSEVIQDALKAVLDEYFYSEIVTLSDNDSVIIKHELGSYNLDVDIWMKKGAGGWEKIIAMDNTESISKDKIKIKTTNAGKYLVNIIAGEL